MRNRIAGVHNQFQDQHKFTRILTVCSAGMLRSPTIARVLQKDFDNVNVRSVGVDTEFALIPIDEALVTWADVIICAEDWHADDVYATFPKIIAESSRGFMFKERTPLLALNIPDNYNFADPELESIIREEIAKIVAPIAATARNFVLMDTDPSDDILDPTDVEEMKYNS